MGDGPVYDPHEDEWNDESSLLDRTGLRFVFGGFFTLVLAFVAVVLYAAFTALSEAPLAVAATVVAAFGIWFLGYAYSDLRPKIQQLRGGDDG